MYRKRLREMETKTSGIKTIDKLNELPIVNSAITNLSDYYDQVKQRNNLLRTSCNLAEFSLKTMSLAATPFKVLCDKPIKNIDSYLSDKVDLLENTYPIITKPTEQLKATVAVQAKTIYDKTLKPSTDKVAGTLHNVAKNGYDCIEKSSKYGIEVLDFYLEKEPVKSITTPILDLTEKSVNYFLNNDAKQNEEKLDVVNHEQSTLKRILDLNRHIFDSLCQKSYRQFMELNYQFDQALKRLQTLRKLSEFFYENSKRGMEEFYSSGVRSLKSICNKFITQENYEKFDMLGRHYFKIILTDVNRIISNYLSLIKNLPIFLNGSKLNGVISSLFERINQEPLTTIVKTSVDNLQAMLNFFITFSQQLIFQQSSNNVKALNNNKKEH